MPRTPRLLSQSQHLFLKLITNLLLLLTSLLQKAAHQVILRLKLLHRSTVGRVVSALFQAAAALGDVSTAAYRALARTINNYNNSDNEGNINDRISTAVRLVSNSTLQESGDNTGGRTRSSTAYYCINLLGGIFDYCVFLLLRAVRCARWIGATTYGCIHALDDLLFDLRVLLECVAFAALKTTYSTIRSAPPLAIHHLAEKTSLLVVSLASVIRVFVVYVENAGKCLKEKPIPSITENMSDLADQGWNSLKNWLHLMSLFFRERVKISASPCLVVACLVVIGMWVLRALKKTLV